MNKPGFGSFCVQNQAYMMDFVVFGEKNQITSLEADTGYGKAFQCLIPRMPWQFDVYGPKSRYHEPGAVNARTSISAP